MSQQEISYSPELNTDWLITIEEKRKEARKAETPDAWDEVCIHRVPRKLRDVNPSAFDPQIVSIGPYHRGKDVLRDMDIHKWRCFDCILNRNNQEASLYFNSIAEVVEKAKRCYEGNINLSIYEFVETMVLDGCFLLEILFGFTEGLTYFEDRGYWTNDPVYSKRGPIELMKEDMLKLENQLPLFILARLLGLISNEDDKTALVTKTVLQLFQLQERILGMEPEDISSCSHCLHIYRCGLTGQFPRPPRRRHKRATMTTEAPAPPKEGGKIRGHQIGRNEKTHKQSTHLQETIHSVTKLREVGVKFKKRETHFFLDIEYKAGVLHIPQLVLDNTIKRQIHNLIAFEQTYHGPGNGHEITSYAVFMDDLIDTSADVAYLHDCGIIDPFAGGSYDDAAKFFNQITDGVIFGKEDMYLQEATEGLSKKINDYHNSRIRNWMVGAKRKYFSNPWSIISLIAAVALLVLTFLQTFYSMYGYYRPRN